MRSKVLGKESLGEREAGAGRLRSQHEKSTNRSMIKALGIGEREMTESAWNDDVLG